MTDEGDLQRLFDSAGSAVDLEPGSLSSVKGRAARRSRNTQLLTTGALGIALMVAGVTGWLALAPGQESVEVATGGLSEENEIDAPGEVSGNDSPVEDNEPAENDTSEQADTPLESGPVTEADFTYLGAFMAPAGDIGNSTFAFGGEAAAFNPAGDPDGGGEFTGSLFMTGHPRQNPGVAELAIPEPELHGGVTEGLPVASVLQPFADVTDGRGFDFVGSAAVGGIDEYRYGGLEVVDGPEGSRLHWSIWQYDNVSNNEIPGHGHSSLNLSDPGPAGPWFLGEANNLVTAGYLFAVPDGFADQFLNGNRLVTGHKDHETTTTRSWGPPFFAYTAPSSAEPNSRVPAVELASYLNGDQLDGYGQGDVTPGAAWVTTTAGASAIVTVGYRGLGEVRQGLPQEGDCSPNAGFHADPYEPQIMFYNPADLAAVAAGERRPADVEPYRSWNPAEHLIPSCQWVLSSLSFDYENRRAYVVQVEADTSQNEFSPVPVVHVFQL